MASRRRAPGSRGAPEERGAGPRRRPLAGTPRPLAAVAVAARRRAEPQGCARAAAWFAAAAEDLVGGGRHRASRPASKLSRTLLRGARGAATRVRGARAAELTAQLCEVCPEAAAPPHARPVSGGRKTARTSE